MERAVNSAGIQRYGTVVDTPEAVWDEVMAVNLKGVFLASKHAVPQIERRGGGAIINIASVQAYASQANVAAYTASDRVYGATAASSTRCSTTHISLSRHEISQRVYGYDELWKPASAGLGAVAEDMTFMRQSRAEIPKESNA